MVKKALSVILDNFIPFLLSTAVTYATTELLLLQANFIFILLVGLILTIGWASLANTTTRIVALAVILLTAATTFAVGTITFKVDLVKATANFIDWNYGFFQGNAEYTALYGYITSFLICTAITIVVNLAVKYLFTEVLLCIAALSICIILCIYGIELPKFTICILLLHIIYCTMQVVTLFFAKDKASHIVKQTARYLLPVCVIAPFIAVTLPSKEEPIQWTTVKSWYNTIVEQVSLFTNEVWLSINAHLSSGEFSVFTTGYSDGDNRLGGQLRESDKKLVTFNMHTKARSDIYLAGVVRDEYTGHSWNNTIRDGENRSLDSYPIVDVYEMLSAFYANGLSKEELEMLLIKRTATITYDQVKTKSLFTPIKTYALELPSSIENLVKFNTETPKFSRIRGRDTQYYVSFYEVNYSSDLFKTIARGMDNFSYKDVTSMGYSDTYISEIQGGDLDYLNPSFYRNRADEIDQRYLSLPQDLPERVRLLAKDITKYCTNNYDRLEAIKTYLKEYEYTKNVTRLPDNRDFVDYFLFDSKQGYCTYYATSMAVLGRCVGIPTRYVEGICLDYTKQKSGLYSGMSTQSHAWAEAYIEGLGWIPFEATSGYTAIGNEWSKPQASQGGSGSSYQPYPPDQNTQGGTLTPIYIPDEEDNSSLETIIILSIIAVLILAVTIGITLSTAIKRRRFRRCTDTVKVYICFEDICFYIKRLSGDELLPKETLKMFADRINGRFCFNGIDFSDIANIYTKVRYAEQEATKTDVEKYLQFKASLNNALIEKLGKLRAALVRIQRG